MGGEGKKGPARMGVETLRGLKDRRDPDSQE